MRAAVCLLLVVGLLGEGCTDWRHTHPARCRHAAHCRQAAHCFVNMQLCQPAMQHWFVKVIIQRCVSISLPFATCVAAGPGVAARALHQASAEADAAASAFSAGSAAQVMVSWDSALTCQNTLLPLNSNF